jgi:hypothetical protein
MTVDREDQPKPRVKLAVSDLVPFNGTFDSRGPITFSYRG